MVSVRCFVDVLLLGFASSSSTPGPSVVIHNGVSNILNPSDHNVVKTLGTFATLDECEKACVTYNNTIPGDPNPDVNPGTPGIVPSPLSGWGRCTSFTHLANGTCYARVDGSWSPFQSSTASSGVVQWSPNRCKSELDCSLNGDCVQGLCDCTPAWEGDKCQTLRLVPTARSAGLQARDEGQNTSTWGGCVLQIGGLYHMWYSEMVNHCGINSCVHNSRIRRATSSNPLGPYTRHETVQPVSTHEPTVVLAPTGEIVMYFLAFHWDTTSGQECHCVNGTTSKGDCARARTSTEKAPGPNGGTYMTWTHNPEGPWSEPELVFMPGQWGEPYPIGTNLAVTILANGSAVGMIKTSGTVQGSTIHLVTASSWRDVSTYTSRVDPVPTSTPFLFQQQITQFGLEDQFVYRDGRGHFHALFHNQMEFDDQRICGGHAFSLDGLDWTFGGTAFGNRVEFDDGTAEVYRRRERPHLLISSDGTPTHLITAVQYGAGWYQGRSQYWGDGSFTLVQPIATTKLNFV